MKRRAAFGVLLLLILLSSLVLYNIRDDSSRDAASRTDTPSETSTDTSFTDDSEDPASSETTDSDAEAPQSSDSMPRALFLIVSKPTVINPPEMQERGVTAVRRIAAAVRKFQPDIVVDALAETVMTKEQYRRGEAKEKVTRDVFKERLERLAATTTAQDTVIIYTHSHGHRNGFEKSQPLGGIVMDLPVRRTGHHGALLWNEYAKLLLDIPAKNVIVLTMSCFSGGFIEYLNSPEVRNRWNNRRQKQGRNFIVLTSQNKDRQSPPIVKDGEVINPFTLAVAKAFGGEADGFRLTGGKPVEPRSGDGRLTAGELIDYILYTTENTVSEAARRRNIAKPQLTGSFDRGDVMIYCPE